MTSAQVVETSVNVTSNSPSEDYTHPDDHNLPNYHSTLFNNLEHFLLCDVEQGAQTNSILLITPENIEKVELILQNIIVQGGTPENKRKVGKIVKHH